MNYMSEVVKMFGVELEEEFKISEYDGYLFKFSKTGMLCQVYPNLELDLDITLIGILKGKYNIVKISKSVLTDKEKECLSEVIKPFRNRIKSIQKRSDTGTLEYIWFKTEDMIFSLCFEKDTMCKGMKLYKNYTIEELDL